MALNKKTVKDINVSGRKALVRVDFNVPLKGGKVEDDTRIRAAIPTIKYLIENGASVILMSHLGRPEGVRDPEASLAPVAERLSELLGKPVNFVNDCVGEEVKAACENLKPGEIILLENLRFHSEEEGKSKTISKEEMKKRQDEFVKKLASLGDFYVNDAFGTAHRAHASTALVAKYFKDKVAGFLMQKEIEYLGKAISNPDRPFVAIIGGAKISDKIEVLKNLVNKVDAMLIGGAMAYTFYLALRKPVGKSLVEPDKVDVARQIMEMYKEKGVEFILPSDHVVADAFKEDANYKIVGENEIPDGWMALDIGPETIKKFKEQIAKAATIVWNGPVGCFEMQPFAKGTMEIARAIASNGKCVSIIGGGDSVSAVNKAGVADKITHISTGGGASLEFLEGKELPGVAVLDDKRSGCCCC